jgi:hypothetical protein
MSKPKPPFIFIVRGRGRFPFDMLRYDQCWPRHERDSTLIDSHTNHPRTEWEVEMMSNTKLPTAARWKSFGWEVQP